MPLSSATHIRYQTRTIAVLVQIAIFKKPSMHGSHWITPGFSVNGFNTMKLRQNGRYYADDIFKCIFLNEISLKTSLKYAPKVRINKIPALVHIMAWHRPGDKPSSGPLMVSLLTHICVAGAQWVNVSCGGSKGPFTLLTGGTCYCSF